MQEWRVRRALPGGVVEDEPKIRGQPFQKVGRRAARGPTEIRELRLMEPLNQVNVKRRERPLQEKLPAGWTLGMARSRPGREILTAGTQ